LINFIILEIFLFTAMLTCFY